MTIFYTKRVYSPNTIYGLEEFDEKSDEIMEYQCELSDLHTEYVEESMRTMNEESDRI